MTQQLNRVRLVQLRSSLLAAELAWTVWLPPSYESSDASFPVIYVLDAPMTFAFARKER